MSSVAGCTSQRVDALATSRAGGIRDVSSLAAAVGATAVAASVAMAVASVAATQ